MPPFAPGANVVTKTRGSVARDGIGAAIRETAARTSAKTCRPSVMGELLSRCLGRGPFFRALPGEAVQGDLEEVDARRNEDGADVLTVELDGAGGIIARGDVLIGQEGNRPA